MALTNFEAIKNADQKTKDIVNCFMKQLQELLPYQQNPYYNIPAIVFMITMSYYYNPEYFTTYGNYMQLNEDKNEIYLQPSAKYELVTNTAYGNIVITKSDIGKHIWTFKIIETNKEVVMGIGLDSSNKEFPNKDFVTDDNTHSYYVYSSYADVESYEDIETITGERYHNEAVDEHSYTKSYGDAYTGTSCEVKMELNMDEKTIRYYVNDEDQGVAFKDICFRNDEEYKMCISFDESVTVQLRNYQHIP